MMNRSDLRNRLGEGYSTYIDEQTIIPWVPLSIGDFLKYEDLSRENSIIPVVLEDEIFKKCVTDPQWLREMDSLPYGTVSIVVQNIMEQSGPLSIDHFNDILERNRGVVQQPLHALIPLIIRAFPGYVPEDLYAMQFETFMLRLAQAETLLISMGIIQEPLSLIQPEIEEKKTKKAIPHDLKAAWDAQNKPKDKPIEKKATKSIFDKNNKPIIHKDLDKERVSMENEQGLLDNEGELRAQLVKDARNIYKDTISNLDYYKKK